MPAGDHPSFLGFSAAPPSLPARCGAVSARWLSSAPAIRFPSMRSTEMRAIGELAGRTAAGAGTMVRDLHVGFASEDGQRLGGPTHLLNHPALYDQIRAWIER